MVKKKKSGDTPKHKKDRYAGQKWKPGEMREYLKELDRVDPRNR